MKKHDYCYAKKLNDQCSTSIQIKIVFPVDCEFNFHNKNRYGNKVNV